MFVDDMLGFVGVGVDDVSWYVVVVGDRVVGEGVVCFFGVVVVFYDEELVFDEDVVVVYCVL